MRALCIVALAACGGKAANRPPQTAAPYLILFKQGASWTLNAVGHGAAITCTVAESKQVADANVSRLDCGSLLVSGTWVSMPAGLYHPHLPVDDVDELALLGDDDLLITKHPAEREHSHLLPGGAQSSVETFGHEGSWCVRQTTRSAAEHRSYTLCFDGTNITGVGEDTHGGNERSLATYGNAPPHDQDDD